MDRFEPSRKEMAAAQRRARPSEENGKKWKFASRPVSVSQPDRSSDGRPLEGVADRFARN